MGDQFDDRDDTYGRDWDESDQLIVDTIHDDTIQGFQTRYDDNAGDLGHDLASSNFAQNEDGTFRDKTQSEMFLRDYGKYLAVLGAFLAYRLL